MIRFALPGIAGFLVPVALAAADPVISEFMASNQSSVADEDRDRSDWIEIRNPTAEAIDLDGWFLTDSASNTSKWRFPAVTLPANAHMIVWASGKDRRTPGQPLHTNFSLAAAGEYLALVKPDGVTPAHEFAPAFPPQYPDISYGASTTATEVAIIDNSAAVKAFVPENNSLATAWRDPGFDDTAWIDGAFGVGFMNYNSGSNPNLQGELGTDLIALGTGIGGTGRNVYIRTRFDIADPSAVISLTLRINYDDGFHAWINGGTSAAASPNAPSESSLRYNSTTGNHNPSGFESFDISSKIGSLVAGANVLAIQVLNTGGSSSDLFASASLLIGVDSGGAGLTGYFTTATPGAANGGTHTIQIPQTVTPSRPSGTFIEPFDLALGGAGPGQEIRYVLATPGSGGATLAEPTASSTLYTDPIPVTQSLLLRAALFDTTNGQRSRTLTAHYLLLESNPGQSNTSNFTSILPIAITDTHGGGQPPDSGSGQYKTAIFHLYEPAGGTTSLTSQAATVSRAGLRVRGSSSAGFPKKSYGMETWDERNDDLDIPLLDMPAQSDWILNGPWLYDDTFIHNAYIFDLSRQIGRWAPRTRFVELFDNKNGGKLDYGDYAGVYVLTEKIKSAGNRLDITGIGPEDRSGEALTGGYIFKIDRADGDEVRWRTSNSVPNQESGQSLVIVEPDPQEDTPEQIAYLQNYIQQFDTILFAERAANFSTRQYRDFIDVPAWIDHHILNSLAYNVDALRLSAFYFKDRGQKIHAGPIWDFDRALRSDDGRDSNPSSWNNIQYFFDRDWWGQLFRDPDFVQAWVDRWIELRDTTFAQANLIALADRMGEEIGNAAGARDAARWPDNAARGGVYLNEIADMKSWLATRMNWITNQMPAPPTASLPSGVVDAGAQLTLTGAGILRFTTDGTDPRPPGGAGDSPAQTYAGQLSLDTTTMLTVRRQLPSVTTVFTGQAAIGTRWSAPVRRLYLVDEVFAERGDIVVSAINYNPLEPTAAESAAVPGVTASDFEWIELLNIGSRTVNLFEVSFAPTRPFSGPKLAPFTLHPGKRALVVKNRAAFTTRYGDVPAPRIAAEWLDGSLDNAGETIVLLARDGTPIQTFTYDDEGAWPGRSDGKGSVLEYVGADFTDADFDAPQNWRSSAEIHGAPGSGGAGRQRTVAINEILTHSAPPYLDAVELRNLTEEPVDVGGWFLSNVVIPETIDSYKLFRIPDGTVIPAGGWVVFDERDFNPNGDWNPAAEPPGPGEFSFDGNHDTEVWLVSASEEGTLRFVDHAEIGPARLNEPLGRLPDGTGPFAPLAQRSLYDETSEESPRPRLGAANHGPRAGPVVIHEIHHTPAGGNPVLQFIELHNTGEDAVDLARWRLRGDADFDFTTESIPPGGLLLILPFTPNDAATTDFFRTVYDLTGHVLMAGPWSASSALGLPGESILYRAGEPPPLEPGYFPLTVEDSTRFHSGDPWPDTTSGSSLQRLVPAASGNAPDQWIAAEPTPGRFALTPEPEPSFETWIAEYFPDGGPGSAPTDDPDDDGMPNLVEYALGEDPLTAASAPPLVPTFVFDPERDPAAYVFTYARPLDPPEVVWSVEISTSLDEWSTVPDTSIALTETTDTRQAVVDATDPQLYFRLKVALPVEDSGEDPGEEPGEEP